jgi:hypothetical protein
MSRPATANPQYNPGVGAHIPMNHTMTVCQFDIAVFRNVEFADSVRIIEIHLRLK